MSESYYFKKHGLFIEDLKVGQQASFTKIISEKDILLFSQVSGDDNPVHTDEKFARQSLFKKRIEHGFLSASLISTVIAKKLPGPGCIYLKQSMKFLAPVFIGDEVSSKVKITEISREKKIISLLTECFIKEKKIITGDAQILVSSKSTLK